jgi:hypothetical protein
LNGVEPVFYQHQPLSGGRRFPKLLLRASVPEVSANIAKLIARLDARLRVQATPLSANLSRELESSRYGATLASMLGACALALATVGTFGVFAYAVRQRTREIGVRVALGAQQSAVVRLILAGQSRAVLWGLGVGLLSAVAASILLRGYLYGLSPSIRLPIWASLPP